MRLKSYMNERSSVYGSGITFMDIDETIFHTTARVIIRKNGEVIARLRNWEFLRYKQKPGEEADFSEYTSGKLFRQTAKPVEKTVARIQKMFKNMKAHVGSRIVIVSARADSDDKEEFLQTFRDFGIPIDDIYIERVGTSGAVAGIPEKKKRVMFKYLKTGLYRRARLVDDSEANCRAFLELEDEIPQETIDMMREKYNIPEGEKVIDFYALNVLKNGSLKRIER